MFATALHIMLLALLFLAMAFGGVLSFAGIYAARIGKGVTRAAQTLDLLCWMLAFVGVLIFTLAAALLVPQVMA